MYMVFFAYRKFIQVHAEAIFLRLFLVFFLYGSIVYAMPFKHDWILMNGLFSSLNARWLCKLRWKHIYFLIDEIHKQINTFALELTLTHTRTMFVEHAFDPNTFWRLCYLHYYFPLYLIFLRTSFFDHEEKKLPISTFNVYAIDTIYFMYQHGSWKINITISSWNKKLLKFNFLIF